MAEVKIYYKIDGDTCYYSNTIYDANYQTWNNTSTAGGKNVSIVLTVGKFTFPTNAKNLFRGCNNSSFNMSNWVTSGCTNMGGLFASCRGLTTLYLSNFNTSWCTDMSDMFEGCSNLVSINLSGFNTSNVTNMVDMFGYCTSLKSIDVSNFNTAKVQYFAGMFHSCKALTSLNLHNFSTISAAHLHGMFQACENLKWLDIYNFTVHQTQVSVQVYDMFSGCKNLERVFIKPNQDWGSQDIIDTNMFANCEKILNWDGTVDKTRANNTKPNGYFGVYGIWMYDYLVFEKNEDSWVQTELYLKDSDIWNKSQAMIR